jgi:hypothetical protein
MRRRRNPEIIAGRIGGDGSVQIGDGFICQRTGVGIYKVILPSGFRILTVTVTPVQAANCNFYIQVGSLVDNTFGVVGYTMPSTNADIAFSFIAVGL